MRHVAREKAFQTIYQIDLGSNEPEVALRYMLEEDTGLKEEERQFCEQLVRGVVQEQAAIDEIIASHAKNWKIERMMSVDRNILRMAVYEIRFCADIPNKVAINEAIELAKVFGSDDSPKFINGILDKVLKSDDTEQIQSGLENIEIDD